MAIICIDYKNDRNDTWPDKWDYLTCDKYSCKIKLQDWNDDILNFKLRYYVQMKDGSYHYTPDNNEWLKIPYDINKLYDNVKIQNVYCITLSVILLVLLIVIVFTVKCNLIVLYMRGRRIAFVN